MQHKIMRRRLQRQRFVIASTLGRTGKTPSPEIQEIR